MYSLFLLFIGVSALFTHSIPLTLESLVIQISLFTTFIFFHSLFKSHKLEVEKVFLSFLTVIFSLSLYFLASLIFKNISYFLPPLNLITLSYGHSHFAFFVLTFLPIVWWFYYSKYSKVFRFKIFFLLFTYAMLFLTFGRFSILLGIIATLFLLKKNIYRKKTVKIFLSTVVLLTVVIVGIVSLPSQSCSNTEFRQQTCKPIDKELRLEYFQTAARSIQENFFLGYGPGTYPLVNSKYSLTGSLSSTFAHNYFLETLSENGFIAFIFLLLFYFVSIRKVLHILKERQKDSIQFFIALGFLLAFLNSLVDFDWNTFVPLQVSMIFLSALFSQENSNEVKNTQGVFIKKSLWWLFHLYIFLIVILSLISKLLFMDNQVNLAVNIYPYLYGDSKKIISHSQLNKHNFQKMMKIYEYDPTLLGYFLTHLDTPYDQLNIFRKLYKVLPWSGTNPEFLLLLKNGNYMEEVGDVAINTLYLIEKSEKKGYIVKYETKEMLSYYVQKSADYYLSKGDYNTAIKYYQKVLSIEEWAIHARTAFFETYPATDLDVTGHFFKELNLRPNIVGRNHDSFKFWLGVKMFQGDPQKNLRDLMLFRQYFGSEDFWSFVSEKILERMRIATNDKYKYYYDLWYDFWLLYVTEEDTQITDKEYHFILMNTLFRFGEDEKAKVLQDYLYRGILPVSE